MCLRGDRIGEADQPGPVMEASVRAFSGAEEKSPCRNGLSTHCLCRNGLSTHVKCFLAVNEILMLVITGRSLLGIVRNTLLLFRADQQNHGGWDGQEGELDARVLALLYSSSRDVPRYC